MHIKTKEWKWTFFFFFLEMNIFEHLIYPWHHPRLCVCVISFNPYHRLDKYVLLCVCVFTYMEVDTESVSNLLRVSKLVICLQSLCSSYCTARYFVCSCQNFKKMFSDKSLSKKETAFSSLGIFSIEMSQLSQSRMNSKEWWTQMSDL